jgi:nucleoid DNA-binding protein
MQDKMHPKKYVKSDLIAMTFASLPKSSRIRKFYVEDIVNLFFTAVADAIVEGKTVEIRGFGVFHPIKSCLTYCLTRNPRTGETWNGFQCRKLVFSPSSQLRKRLLYNDFNVFKTYADSSHF